MTTHVFCLPITASPSTVGRFCLNDVELTSGDSIEVELGQQILPGRVEFDQDLQRYVVVIEGNLLLLKAGLRAVRRQV